MAYEMGILKNPDATPLQYWSLSYYLNSMKRDRVESQNRMTMEFMAFLAPEVYQAITKSQAEPEEPTNDFGPVDFNDLEQMFKDLEEGGTLTTTELADEAGWI